MLGITRVASGDVKAWLLIPTLGEVVEKLMLLLEVPIRAAPATSPMNWKSPSAYWPLIPSRGPAPVNREFVVLADAASPSGLWNIPVRFWSDAGNFDAAEGSKLEGA